MQPVQKPIVCTQCYSFPESHVCNCANIIKAEIIEYPDRQYFRKETIFQDLNSVLFVIIKEN